MTITYVTTDMPNGIGIAAQGDVLDVLSNGIVTNAAGGAAVTSSYGSEIDVFGTVAGGDYGLYSGTSGQVSYVYVGLTGNVDSAYYSSQFANVAVETTGTAYVTNYGEVLASGSSGVGIGVNGASTIINHGDVNGNSGGIFSNDSLSSDVLTFDNYGAIDSNSYAFRGRSELDNIFNAGTMTGSIILSSKAGDSIDNSGTINGSINASNGAEITDSGMITGTVSLSSGTVNLNDTQISVSGGSNAVNFVTGASNVVTLSETSSNWDSVNGYGGTVILKGALANIAGYDNIQLQSASGQSTGASADIAVLYGTNGVWDNVSGSGGAVILRDAFANIAGDDNVEFDGDFAGNYAVLSDTKGQFDNVTGSGGTVLLRGAYANISGDDTIAFQTASGQTTGATGDLAVLSGTNGGFDYVSGSGTSLILRDASVDLTGSNDAVTFDNHFSGDFLNMSGAGDTVALGSGIGGADTVLGFASGDILQLSKTDFANFAALQNSGDLSETGGNTVIAIGSDKVTVQGYLVASSQFAFV